MLYDIFYNLTSLYEVVLLLSKKKRQIKTDRQFIFFLICICEWDI